MDEQKITLTASIVAAYVSNNRVMPDDVSALIKSTYAALSGTVAPAASEAVELTPAVSIRKSVTPERIICLDCGKPFASIKRHLLTAHELSPADYRSRWSLPHDYLLVAPLYSERRSTLAKSLGLGRIASPPALTVAEPAPVAAPAKAEPKANGKRQPGEPAKPARPKLKLKFDDVSAKPKAAAEAAKERPTGAIDPAQDEFT